MPVSKNAVKVDSSEMMGNAEAQGVVRVFSQLATKPYGRESVSGLEGPVAEQIGGHHAILQREPDHSRAG